MWLAYYVPHRVGSRQDALDASLTDRFSASLRVLAVGGGSRVPAMGTGSSAPALTAGTARAMITGTALGDDLPTTSRRNNVLMSEASDRSAEQFPTRPARPAPRASSSGERPASARPAAAPRSHRPASPSRIAVLERRAAAARRRLTITLVLVLASVGGWVAVGMTSVTIAAGIVPTALLGGVLVLGRRAVISARRSDAAWSAERRERAAVRAARGVTGGPVEPRNSARVTGFAVHGSQVTTQMIPRVTPDMIRPTAAPTESETAPASGSQDGDRAGEEPVRAPAPETPEVAVEADVSTTPPAPRPSTEPWDPTPVPRPTYTMKAAAPRREPAPMPEPTIPAAPAESAPTAAPSSDEAPAATATTDPPTDTLGLNLNEILARRRASGQ